MTSRTADRIARIVETDRREAVGAATEAIIARALAEAPVGYAELTAAARAGTAGQLVAGLTLPVLRLVAVRWLVERGGPWTWGEADSLQGKLAAQAAHAAIALASEVYEPGTEERAEVAAWCAACEEAEPRPRVRRDQRTSSARALDRARLRLRAGAVVEPVGVGAYLVASNSRSGHVHRVEAGVCSCEARGECWHLSAVELIEEEAQIDDEAQQRWARDGRRAGIAA